MAEGCKRVTTIKAVVAMHMKILIGSVLAVIVLAASGCSQKENPVGTAPAARRRSRRQALLSCCSAMTLPP